MIVQVRGEITTMRLDSLIDHDVQILKIDVEGGQATGEGSIQQAWQGEHWHWQQIFTRGATLPACDAAARHTLTHSNAFKTGFEQPILTGGEGLFKKYNVWFMMAGEPQAGAEMAASVASQVLAPPSLQHALCTCLLCDWSPPSNVLTECNKDIIKEEGQRDFLK